MFTDNLPSIANSNQTALNTFRYNARETHNKTGPHMLSFLLLGAMPHPHQAPIKSFTMKDHAHTGHSAPPMSPASRAGFCPPGPQAEQVLIWRPGWACFQVKRLC